jgi:hypothetical protein
MPRRESDRSQRSTVRQQSQDAAQAQDPSAEWALDPVATSGIMQRVDIPPAQRRRAAGHLGTALGNQALVRTVSPVTVQRQGELSGTSPIASSKQQRVEQILNPNRTATGETEPFIEAGFEDDMRDKLDEYVVPQSEAAREQLDPDSPKLDISHIQDNIASEAQSVVRNKYGSYARAASMSPSERRHQNRYQLGSNVQAYSDQPINTAVLRDLTEYLMTVSYVGGPVMVDHHVDRSRSDDRNAFRAARDRYLRENREALTLIQRSWPGEMNPNTLQVFIQKNLSPETDQENTAVERRGYWGTFETLIHEYIHVLEHPRLYEMAVAQSSTGYQILIEGLCDHFAEQVWQDVEPTLPSDDTRRERIEGHALDYDANAIPDWDSYPEIVPARKIVAQTGEENARAAYFMGHTELLGGGDYETQDTARDGTYTVPTDGQTVADVATITHIPVEELAALNSVGEEERLLAGDLLDCPDVHYHVVIPYDYGIRIAEQYGIPFPLLDRANPGVDWQSIQPGQRLLIPRP